MKRGMLHKRCPVCGKIIYYQAHQIDVVHQCRESDGTRKTAQTERELIPSRINLKIDEDAWNAKGVDSPPKDRPQTSKDDSILEEINVDTYLRLS